MSQALPPHPVKRTAHSQERKLLLGEAHRCCIRGRHGRAIALYRRALLADPSDIEVSLKLAPLLALRGDHFEAWRLFSEAGKRLLRARRHEQSLAVFREACRCLPHHFEAWRIRAEIEMKLGWEDIAFETLLEGRHHFRSVHMRAQAIALLVMARAIEPWDAAVLLDLARLYARSEQHGAALELLIGLSHRTGGRMKRRVRAAQLGITHSPHHLWLWLRAVWDELRGEPEGAPECMRAPDCARMP